MRPNVIFDCDGVLVDSEPISNGVLAAMLTDLGLPTTAEESMAAHLGRAWPSVAEIIEARLGRPLDEDFRPRYVEGMLAAFERELEPVPGIVEALDAIDNPSCVASSGSHEKMRMTLAHTGLLERFEGRAFSAQDVPHPKPAPDLFLHAARSMGARPSRCAVVEDTPTGVRAAVAAGMAVFAFAGAVHADREALRQSGGRLFDRMSDLPSLLAA